MTSEIERGAIKAQTFTSFQDKWTKNQSLAFSETSRVGSDIFNWILTRNGFSTPQEFSDWLRPKRKILDAGCGNGRVTALLRSYSNAAAKILGIDLTSAEVARSNLASAANVEFRQKDVLGDLSDIGKFDLIYCQEVLHHTADPRKSFLNLCERLEEGGEIAIYVYKEKAPLREHADDYVRELVSALPYEDAMASMAQVTELGKALSELNINIKVPDVDVLGIKAGEYDVQRFIYHFFLKCFWNPALSYQDNVAINYDWYHPQLCTRHNLSEVHEWFAQAGLKVIHDCVDHYGITVRGIRG
jgi:SAM-dependent methyltransferase